MSDPYELFDKFASYIRDESSQDMALSILASIYQCAIQKIRIPTEFNNYLRVLNMIERLVAIGTEDSKVAVVLSDVRQGLQQKISDCVAEDVVIAHLSIEMGRRYRKPFERFSYF